MAVKIRLNRVGSKNRPYYRIVVTDSRNARGSGYIEILGQYNPLLEKGKFSADKVKILDWIKKGAKPSFTVRKLLGEVGILKALDVKNLPKKAPKTKGAAGAEEAPKAAVAAEAGKEAPKKPAKVSPEADKGGEEKKEAEKTEVKEKQSA